MNYDLLFAGGDKKTVEIAIIGVQGFNHSLFVYGSKNNRVSIRVLCGRNTQKCVDAYLSIGIDEQSIIHCTSPSEGLDAFSAGKYLVFNDVSLAMQMPIDLVVEGTGNTEASARYILAAIEHGKHAIMVTKESDSVVGPLLARKARDKGVIYSLAEGDQPALLIVWSLGPEPPVLRSSVSVRPVSTISFTTLRMRPCGFSTKKSKWMASPRSGRLVTMWPELLPGAVNCLPNSASGPSRIWQRWPLYVIIWLASILISRSSITRRPYG